MKLVITHACCILLGILVSVVTAQDDIECPDETTPSSGYQWISSGMENEYCYGTDLTARYGDICGDDDSNTLVQGQQSDEDSSSQSGGNGSSGSSRKKRDDASQDDQVREDRSVDSSGNTDDPCIKRFCCQGDLVYALVNSSCLCPPEVTYTEGTPMHTEELTVSTDLEFQATPTEASTESEETTTIAMTAAEGITLPVTFSEGVAISETATGAETTTVAMTIAEAMTTDPVAIAEQEAADGPIIIEDVVVSNVDGMENVGVQGDQGDRDESSDESSSSQSEKYESDDEGDTSEVSTTDDLSSGNYSMANDTEGTKVLSEGERCNVESGDAEDNGESGENETSDSGSKSSDSSSSDYSDSSSSSRGVAKVCQEGLVCTPVGNGKSECLPGQPEVTPSTVEIIIDTAIAQNQAPEGQSAAVNFVSGVTGPQLPCTKLLFLFVLIFVIILY